MAEPPVANASPVIVLARGNRLELLRVAGPRVVIPSQVAEEIRRRGPEDVTARALAETPWLEIVETGPPPAEIEAQRLGPGESAVLTWALRHPGTEAIIDDLAARRLAAELGIPTRGTLGLVLAAKQAGIIGAARPVVEELRQIGLYLSDRIIAQALRRVGE